MIAAHSRPRSVAALLADFVADHATHRGAADRAERAAVGERGTRHAANSGAADGSLLLVSHANALALGRRFIEAIEWAP